MANKPNKFGQKFWMAADVDSKYMLNAFPYLGKDLERSPDEGQSFHVVMKISEPYLGKGRTVNADNFFTSVKLAAALKNKQTTLVGTLSKIRQEVPLELKTYRAELHATRLLKHDDATLTVYQGKKEKHVLLLSTIHPSVNIAENQKCRSLSVITTKINVV